MTDQGHDLVVVACEGGGADRAAVLSAPGGLVVVVADGAGGGEAAQAVVDLVAAACARGVALTDRAAFCQLLVEADRLLEERRDAGESTATVVALSRGAAVGASVGDSGALLVSAAGAHGLTDDQERRPLLGSGGAIPRPFAHRASAGSTLVVASDGLLAYARRDRLVQALRGAPRGSRASALVDLVRLPSGAVQDDVAVAVVDVP